MVGQGRRVETFPNRRGSLAASPVPTASASPVQQGNRYAAVIIIASSPNNPVTSDANQLTDIDTKLDDGNLTSGNFFLGYRNYPVFVLEH